MWYFSISSLSSAWDALPESSGNFTDCLHWHPLRLLGVAALEGYTLHVQALRSSSRQLDRNLGLHQQDPSVGVGQLAYAGMRSVVSEDFQQDEGEAWLLEILIPR